MAEEEAENTIEEAREKASHKVEEAEEKADYKVEEAEKQAQEIINQTRQRAKSVLVGTEEEIKKKRAEVKAEIHDLYSEMKRDKEQLEQELEKMHQEAQKKIDLKLKSLAELEAGMEAKVARRMKEIDTEAENTIEEAREKASHKVEEAEEKADYKVEEAEKQAQEIINQTRQRVDDLARSEKDLQKQKREMNIGIKNFHSQMKTDRKKFEQELEKMRQEAERKVILESEKLRLELEAKTKANTDKKLEEARKQAREITALAHQQADDEISATEQKIEKRERQADDEIQSLRFRTIKKFQNQRQAIEQEENRRNQLKAMRFQKELNEVLRVRIRPYLKDQDNLDRVSAMFDKSINVITLGKIEDDFIEDEYDVNSDLHQKKAKNFWLVSGLSVLTAVTLLVFLPTFREVALETGRGIATEDAKETQKKIIKARTRNDLSKEFRPNKVSEFLGTYTDRVLYTRDYVAIELSKEYRQKWILELQNYFTEKLKLSENGLVPFIAQESNLIRELDGAMKKINGHFVDKGIARMREIEKSFEKKLQAQIGQKNKYKEVMAFKKAFFERNADKFREKASSNL